MISTRALWYPTAWARADRTNVHVTARQNADEDNVVVGELQAAAPTCPRDGLRAKSASIAVVLPEKAH